MLKIAAHHIILFSLLLVAVFFLGFWRGQVSMLNVHDEHVVLMPPSALKKTEQGDNIFTEGGEVINASRAQNKTANSIDDDDAQKSISSIALSEDTSSNFTPLTEDASANELLTFLIDIASSENADDMQYFARTMDQLRDLVSNDPSAIQALLDTFMLADAESKSPYYVISVLQGANIQNREQVFENLAQQLLAENSANAHQKFLHLVSSTGLQESNVRISNMLADIALYSNMETSNRLYALDLLKPYQLEPSQKQNIVSDLKLNINNMEESQRSYAIENMMRFSEAFEREEMAREFLTTTNDVSTRVAVLTSLHSGTIKPSQTLKDQLFTIANNANDPLSDHAKHALLHVFDINKSEYEQLNSGS